METTKGISLTTNELASVLALCGYESMANDVINNLNVLESEEGFTSFLQETEASLRMKGFWNDQRETMIEEGLESLITLLVHSKKKIRIIRGQKVTFIHHLDQNNLLLQMIADGQHRLEIIKNQELKQVLENFCGGGRISAHEFHELEALKLDETIYNQLHQLTDESADMLLSENLPFSLRIFLEDFKANGFEFDNASLMEMKFEQDYLAMNQVFFFLNTDSYIWLLDYDKVEENELYVLPMSIQDFNSLIFSIVTDYFIN
ncbi:hypothetical protein JOC77_001015 [Peribacillus deserti]|uniref:SMI1/KNR4 family protein n=1 Tax=Peribacillus deserti TaxID=673318 RepID=A0ABS2QEN4_9BACI|nr:hypothetical protein [Peribacillus deserti]MBM7691608.1 hypothetical protein [Peribacillus deserti]